MTTQQIAQTIEASLEAGIYAFDHADIYGGYTTEQDFGDGFTASGVTREEVVFVSKCGIRYPSEGATHSVKHYDYSAEYIENALEKSLRKLQTDYIDVFLLHRPSPLLDPRVAVPVLEKLRGQGKIKEWGVSNFTPSQLALMETEGTPQWNQIEYSLTHTTPMLDGTMGFHQSRSIGTMAWSPLGGGSKNQEWFKIDWNRSFIACLRSMHARLNASYWLGFFGIPRG
jgi:predicted oxidoreductase